LIETVNLNHIFLGTFAEFRKVTISFVMSVCLSVRSREKTRLPLDELLWNLIFECFRKSVEKTENLLKSNKVGGYFTYKQIYFLKISRSDVLRIKHVSYKNGRENQNTHFVINNFSSNIVSFVR